MLLFLPVFEYTLVLRGLSAGGLILSSFPRCDVGVFTIIFKSRAVAVLHTVQKYIRIRHHPLVVFVVSNPRRRRQQGGGGGGYPLYSPLLSLSAHTYVRA